MKRIVFILLLLAMVFAGCKNNRKPKVKAPVEIENKEEKSTKPDLESADSLSTKPIGLNEKSFIEEEMLFWPVQPDYFYAHPAD